MADRNSLTKVLKFFDNISLDAIINNAGAFSGDEDIDNYDLDTFEYGVGYDSNGNCFMFDKEDLIGYKDSPIDCGPDIFLQMFNERVVIE